MRVCIVCPLAHPEAFKYRAHLYHGAPAMGERYIEWTAPGWAIRIKTTGRGKTLGRYQTLMQALMRAT